MNASIISLNCVSILSLSSLFYLNDQYYGKQSNSSGSGLCSQSRLE